MISVEEKIKGVRSYSSVEYEKFIYEKERAYCSFNYERLARVYRKYHIECPPDTPETWSEIAKKVLKMEDASYVQKRNAKQILDELNEDYRCTKQ